jgi:hypothetical protein
VCIETINKQQTQMEEKVVVIFDRIDKTAITVIESLGGEIQKQEANNFKEKEVELLVPDSVKFYDWYGQITLQVSDGIGLTKDIHGDSFLLCGIKEAEELTPIKCKLVPVKYEDIQVGDFVTDPNFAKHEKSSYFMKHGEVKFCAARSNNTFAFDLTQHSKSPLLKVVRC